MNLCIPWGNVARESFKPSVLASSSCCNNIPQTGGLKEQKFIISEPWRLGSPRSRFRQASVSAESSFPGLFDGPVLVCIFPVSAHRESRERMKWQGPWGRRGGSLTSHLIRTPALLDPGAVLITSLHPDYLLQGPVSSTHALVGWGFNLWLWGTRLSPGQWDSLQCFLCLAVSTLADCLGSLSPILLTPCARGARTTAWVERLSWIYQ